MGEKAKPGNSDEANRDLEGDEDIDNHAMAVYCMELSVKTELWNFDDLRYFGIRFNSNDM